jgi:hypothetical protein
MIAEKAADMILGREAPKPEYAAVYSPPGATDEDRVTGRRPAHA